ncbi:unnamed protein product [Meloidogyne enterolobii]|uniref:Uncharacterized protein n=1 Tax=Meloidogyne enterolobii TaxID=390850 RepID=A0ACB0ZHF4_MELEN
MSEKTSLSFNDLSITGDSCCSTSCMLEDFNQRLQNLEEILNEKNKNVKKEGNFEEDEKEIKELNNELTKNKDLVSQLEIEKSANEKEFNLLLIQIGQMFLGNSTIKIITEQPKISHADKLALLTSEFKKINEENNKVHFVPIPNKIDTSDYPFTIGMFSVENDKINYNGKEDEGFKEKNYICTAYGQSSFDKELSCCRRILFYFEITMIKEWAYKVGNVAIGFNDVNAKIYLSNDNCQYLKTKRTYYQKFHWKDDDTFGCGVVFPPNKESSDSYVFFTKNGNRIGSRIFLKENDNNLRPTIELNQISVETNFGNNLSAKPFSYDVYNHSEAIFSHY